jgi:hypothetical protein
VCLIAEAGRQGDVDHRVFRVHQKVSCVPQPQAPMVGSHWFSEKTSKCLGKVRGVHSGLVRKFFVLETATQVVV